MNDRFAHLPAHLRRAAPLATRAGRGEPLPSGSELVRAKPDPTPAERCKPPPPPLSGTFADLFRRALAVHLELD